MNTRATIIACALLSLLLGGCNWRKPKQPIALAKLPELAYPQVLPPPEPQPAPATPTTEVVPLPKPEPKLATKSKPKPKAGRPQIIEKPSANGSASASSNPPQKVVISPGSVSRPATQPGESISAGMPHTDEVHHRQTTAQLIQSTEDNLRMLNRQLTSAEQEVVDQIKNFLAQSRAAAADNDMVRANNLALKAHLLSDELVRQ